jgi:Ala-tRNA(Pro) deacylase
MIAHNLRELLDSHLVRYHIVPHEPRFTAQEAAQTAHVSGKHFAKAVIVRVLGGNGPSHHLMAVLPAHERIDLARLGAQIGAPVMLAPEEEIEALFPGIELGAIPPFGALAHVPVVVDRHLAEARWIVFHGGRLTYLVEMRWNDYRAVVHPRILDFGAVPVAARPEAQP